MLVCDGIAWHWIGLQRHWIALEFDSNGIGLKWHRVAVIGWWLYSIAMAWYCDGIRLRWHWIAMALNCDGIALRWHWIWMVLECDGIGWRLHWSAMTLDCSCIGLWCYNWFAMTGLRLLWNAMSLDGDFIWSWLVGWWISASICTFGPIFGVWILNLEFLKSEACSNALRKRTKNVRSGHFGAFWRSSALLGPFSAFEF